MVNIPLFIHTISSLSIHPSMETFVASKSKPLVNSATVNVGVHVSCQFMVFPGLTPRSGVAVSSGSSVFRFSRNHHTALQSGC